MSFGQRLKERREDMRLSGTALGAKLEPPVSKQTIAHWEANRYRPQIDQVAQLCAILHISADALVHGVAGTPSPAAASLANAYDELSAEDRAQWDLILRAMPRAIKPALSQNDKTDEKTGKPANSLPSSDTTMAKSALAEKQLGPALREDLITGTGAKNAGHKPKKVSKQRAGGGS